MHCTNCGELVPEGAAFCVNCGSPVSGAESSAGPRAGEDDRPVDPVSNIGSSGQAVQRPSDPPHETKGADSTVWVVNEEPQWSIPKASVYPSNMGVHVDTAEMSGRDLQMSGASRGAGNAVAGAATGSNATKVLVGVVAVLLVVVAVLAFTLLRTQGTSVDSAAAPSVNATARNEGSQQGQEPSSTSNGSIAGDVSGESESSESGTGEEASSGSGSETASDDLGDEQETENSPESSSNPKSQGESDGSAASDASAGEDAAYSDDFGVLSSAGQYIRVNTFLSNFSETGMRDVYDALGADVGAVTEFAVTHDYFNTPENIYSAGGAAGGYDLMVEADRVSTLVRRFFGTAITDFSRLSSGNTIFQFRNGFICFKSSQIATTPQGVALSKGSKDLGNGAYEVYFDVYSGSYDATDQSLYACSPEDLANRLGVDGPSRSGTAVIREGGDEWTGGLVLVSYETTVAG